LSARSIGSDGVHDADLWARYEAARLELAAQFDNSQPAPRYRSGSALAA
jgi:hypothetical protein